jgi:branched-chain amino acid aminotransferase
VSGAATWINGAFASSIDATDRGLTLGDGVFDTFVAFGGVPFAGDAHLARLIAQARVIGIKVDPALVRAGWDEVLGRLKPSIRSCARRSRAARAGAACGRGRVTALPWL